MKWGEDLSSAISDGVNLVSSVDSEPVTSRFFSSCRLSVKRQPAADCRESAAIISSLNTKNKIDCFCSEPRLLINDDKRWMLRLWGRLKEFMRNIPIIFAPRHDGLSSWGKLISEQIKCLLCERGREWVLHLFWQFHTRCDGEMIFLVVSSGNNLKHTPAFRLHF